MSTLQQLLVTRLNAFTTSNSYIHFPRLVSNWSKSYRNSELRMQILQFSSALQNMAMPGSYVIIAAPHSNTFSAALLACIHANLVAVPLPLDSLQPIEQDLNLLSMILSQLAQYGKVVILIDSLTNRDALTHIAHIECACLTTFEELKTEDTIYHLRSALSSDNALLLFSSGSSHKSKGIVLSHSNLAHQIEAGIRQWSINECSHIVTWLSPAHNFGLHFGLLVPWFKNATISYIHPFDYMECPAFWFKTVAHFGATHIAGPNFAFDYCCNWVGVDQLPSDALSTVTHIICGGEQIRTQTVRRFFEKFAALGAHLGMFKPHFGLSETGALTSLKNSSQNRFMCLDAHALNKRKWVTTLPDQDKPHIEVANCGFIDGNIELRIVHPESEALCGEDEIGEIWVKSPSVAKGYLQSKSIHPKRHRCATSCTDDSGFFRTGDLGIIMDDCLYVTGRLKEMLILRGKNHYPEHIEASITALAETDILQPLVITIERDDEEQVVVVIAVKHILPDKFYTKISSQIRRKIAKFHGIALNEIAFVEYQQLFSTHTSKIIRRVIKEAYESDQMPLLWRDCLSSKADDSTLIYQKEEQSAKFVNTENGTVEAKLCNLWQSLLGQKIQSDTDFFATGGDSVLAIQMISRIRDLFGVEYTINDLFNSGRLNTIVRQIKQLQAKNIHKKNPDLIPIQHTGFVPASYAQVRLWMVHEHMQDQRTSYNIASAMHFTGTAFSIEAMRTAFNMLVARHEVLRTCFNTNADGEVYQVIATDMLLDIPLREAAIGEVATILEENMREIFDLRHGPLFRACILRLSADHHVVISSIHHIISDGWSLGVFTRDLRLCYLAHINDSVPSLPPLVVQYSDYALWQRKLSLDLSLSYWIKALDGYDDGLPLPYDRSRGATRAWRAGLVKYRYPDTLAHGMTAYGQQHQATLFMLLLASMALVLSRYGERDDVCIGATVSGRDQLELENLIGFFINILPLRVNLSGDPSFEELFMRTRQVVLDGFIHQAVPFEHILQALCRPRDSSQIPLVPVILRHQNFPVQEVHDWAEGVKITQVDMGTDRTTPSELDWQFYGDGSYLELTLEYAKDLFDEETIRRMIEHHQRSLEAMLTQPQTRITRWDILTTREQELFAAMNATNSSQQWPCLVRQFERQVKTSPGAIACISSSQSLNYALLDARTNQLAHALRALGAGADVRIAVNSARTAELLMALLAIFKSGATYVPIDPAYPAAYREQLLTETQPQIVLSQCELELDDTQTFCDPRWRTQSETALDIFVRPGDLACVMMTSGSTGRPKGVMIPYVQLHNWLHASWQRFPFAAEERVLQKTAISFAVSLKELLSGLLEGVCQVLLTDGQVKDTLAMAQAIEYWQITRLYLIPSHLQALLTVTKDRDEMLRSLRHIVTAGEALPAALRQEVNQRLPQTKIWNNYGCTELNDITYCTPDIPVTGEIVPIGSPIANTRVYVLDRKLRQVPIGIIGELYVTSIGMARGYWNQPGLTAACFIAHPHSDVAGVRLYKTGDMVRRMADGLLEYMGRQDFETKVRGHRVDIRQVESALRSQPTITDAAVTGYRMGDDIQLVAYVVAEAGKSADEMNLKRQLSARLPGYMVPASYEFMENLPYLPNGKLNRMALPVPQKKQTQNYVPPRNEMEKKLAALFGEVLRVEQIGVHDDFFALGGHSLSATLLISRIRQSFHVDLPLTRIFESPTVESLINQIVSPNENAVHCIAKASRTRTIPISLFQERLWFVHQHMPEQRTSYNGTIALRLRGYLSIKAMRAALRSLVMRHEILHTRFVLPQGAHEPVQVIDDCVDINIPLLPVNETQIAHHIDKLASHTYNLSNGPLFIARILQLNQQEHVLLIGMHHLIYDAWSQFSVMSRDLRVLYNRHMGLSEIDLPELPIQYADYAVWQRTLKLNKQIAFWKKVLHDYDDGLELPYDYPRPHNRTWHAAIYKENYSPNLVKRLITFTQKHQSTLFIGLLASFAIVLHKYTGREDLCIGTTTAGRTRLELENLIGFFINILPIRIKLDGNPNVTEIMKRTRYAAMKAFDNQSLPFENLLNIIKKQRDSSRVPLVPVVIRHQNFPATTDFWNDDIEIEVIQRELRTTPNEIDLQFFGDSSGLSITVEYAAELFSETTIRRMIQHHQFVIEQMIISNENESVN